MIKMGLSVADILRTGRRRTAGAEQTPGRIASDISVITLLAKAVPDSAHWTSRPMLAGWLDKKPALLAS